jgi:hypothetical protein
MNEEITKFHQSVNSHEFIAAVTARIVQNKDKKI